jgi:ABC-type nitrate/sulfonate/bicarbonate transport system ATPase subunit
MPLPVIKNSSIAWQVTKALQLQLACDQRIGVILVGPSGAGKTTLWRLLEGAQTKLGHRPIVYRCRPFLRALSGRAIAQSP